MLIYADTSALVKLVADEPETDQLRLWLADMSAQLVTSELTTIELLRAAARYAPGRIEPVRAELGRPELVRAESRRMGLARAVLDRTTRVGIGGQVLSVASTLSPSTLRSLDAIHLATAVLLADQVTVMLTYDRRLADAARSHGFQVAAPGASD